MPKTTTPPRGARKESFRKAKGMHDILADEYLLKENFIEKAKKIASFYEFQPIQTPILEKVELFTTSIGETTDIIEKEMYNLKTKGREQLVLRPEGTAAVVRAYIENGMQSLPQPVMLHYHGPFFRYERSQKGRTREFQQFGLEILGETDAIADAVIIKTTQAILEEAGKIKNLTLKINSVGDKECRETYQRELINYYKKNSTKLCKNCVRRLKTNPMRLLDCKEEGCQEIKENAPQIMNFLCTGCSNHFKDVLETLDASEVSYYLDHTLVRGLDYYSRTAFEFIDEDTGLVVCGGGRYDPLSKILSGKEVSGVGAAIGIDRVLEKNKKKQSVKTTTKRGKPAKVFFIQLGVGARYKSLAVLEKLRKSKIPTKHSLSKSSLKGQLKLASKLKIPYTLILGQKEALEDSIIVRNMITTSQETIKIEKLIDHLKKKIK